MTKPACVVRCIHGIHSKEGDNNMSRFAPHLARALPDGLVKLNEYGFMGFWQARWRNDGVAQTLAINHKRERIRGVPEVWVTHSNGAVVAYLAVRDHGAMPDMIININPALDRWRTAPVECVETIHSRGDRAVYVSQFLPFHLWGDQGLVGYCGRADNTLNHDASVFPEGMAYSSHTGAFSETRRAKWATFVASRIEKYLERRLLSRTDRRFADMEGLR